MILKIVRAKIVRSYRVIFDDLSTDYVCKRFDACQFSSLIKVESEGNPEKVEEADFAVRDYLLMKMEEALAEDYFDLYSDFGTLYE